MFAIALVLFREVFEIALIVSILMVATKTLKNRTPWIFLGIIWGIFGACLIAFFADAISKAAEGLGQEILNAVILLIAASLIGWTTIWMVRHGKLLSQEFKQLGQEVTQGKKPLYTLAFVIALATLREGAEIVLFTYSAFLTGTKVLELVFGGLLGLCAGVSIGVVLYYSLIKIPTRKIFAVTSWLLIFLVAGMTAQAFGYLTAAGVVPEIIPQLWDTSSIVSSASFLGKVMHVMVGYTDRPTGIQILVYAVTIGVLAMFLNLSGNLPMDKIKKSLSIFFIGIGLFIMMPYDAHASKKVYSPIVEKGELEIEARGQYDTDERAAKDNVQQHKYAVGYGVTDRWFTEIYGEFERTKNADNEDLNFKFTALSWENRLQLTEQGQFPVDVGLYLEYESSFENKHPDNLEAKLLLEKSLPNFTHTLNLTLEQNVGRHPSKDLVGGFAWSSKYRWQKWLQPGFEWHSNLGELGQNVAFSTQQHQLGPAFYGKIGHVKYDVGYLFGMSDAAPKGEIKWIMEYEVKF